MVDSISCYCGNRHINCWCWIDIKKKREQFNIVNRKWYCNLFLKITCAIILSTYDGNKMEVHLWRDQEDVEEFA